VPVPAILNQTAARSLFGSENPMGRIIRKEETRYTVVGLARDNPPPILKSKPTAIMFLPFTAAVFQKDPTQGITVLVRGTAGHEFWRPCGVNLHRSTPISRSLTLARSKRSSTAGTLSWLGNPQSL